MLEFIKKKTLTIEFIFQHESHIIPEVYIDVTKWIKNQIKNSITRGDNIGLVLEFISKKNSYNRIYFHHESHILPQVYRILYLGIRSIFGLLAKFCSKIRSSKSYCNEKFL